MCSMDCTNNIPIDQLTKLLSEKISRQRLNKTFLKVELKLKKLKVKIKAFRTLTHCKDLKSTHNNLIFICVIWRLI